MTTLETGVQPLALSFMSANYVARELGYRGGEDWGPFDAATNSAFQPVSTYAERLDAVLEPIAAAGFSAIDLWLAHLNWRWATREHVLIARQALGHHCLRVVSLAGNFGGTRSELAAACRLANALDVEVLGGMGDVLRDDRPGAEEVLREHGVRFAYENHPEHDPQEVLDLIGDATDVLGAAIDTGWWATHGYDPVQAIRDLRERTFYVHLKDVSHVGEPHLTCPHGEGVVDIPACVDELLASGYAGALSIEHEPYDHDPTAECVQMREALEERLATRKAAHNV
jgi:sugar phosphate isomerase/epimerase